MYENKSDFKLEQVVYNLYSSLFLSLEKSNKTYARVYDIIFAHMNNLINYLQYFKKAYVYLTRYNHNIITTKLLLIYYNSIIIIGNMINFLHQINSESTTISNKNTASCSDNIAQVKIIFKGWVNAYLNFLEQNKYSVDIYSPF